MRLMLAVLVIAGFVGTAYAQVEGTSPTCGPINGKTRADLEHERTFCAQGITTGAVEGAYAMESLLWVKVSEAMARALRADHLRGEQLVKTWMRGWKSVTGSKAVTVTVEWRDVEIAEGETTLLSGDQVTFH